MLEVILQHGGTKGQKSRAGHKSLVFFEGGNVPFYRRMPKFAGL